MTILDHKEEIKNKLKVIPIETLEKTEIYNTNNNNNNESQNILVNPSCIEMPLDEKNLIHNTTRNCLLNDSEENFEDFVNSLEIIEQPILDAENSLKENPETVRSQNGLYL